MFAQASRERPLSAEIHEHYLLSLLFGWEYSPKSHLFVAYNEALGGYACWNRDES